MNRLSRERPVQVVKALVEGNGINGITRMTGVAKNTSLPQFNLSDIIIFEG